MKPPELAVRLPVKLSILLACAATLPLVLVLALVIPGGAQALQRQLGQLYAQDAKALALECQRSMLDDLEALSLAARTLRLGDLRADAREQALLLLYRETRRADVIGLFDEKGEPVSNAVRFENLDGETAREHEVVGDPGMAAYSHHVPLEAALETGLAIGPVYALPDPAGAVIPRVVLAVRVPDKRWVLAMELSLRPIVRLVQEYRAGETGRAVLVDSRNRTIVHSDTLFMRDRADLSADPLLAQTGGEALGAVATAPLLGWKVIVRQSAEEGLDAIHKLRLRALGLIALALAAAIVAGVLLVRRVTEPVQRIRDAARAVRGGNLDAHADVSGADELAQLAGDFNGMVADLREREQLKVLVSLSSTIDLQQMLHRLLDQLGRLAPFDRSVVALARSGEFELAHARGFLDDDEPRLLVPRPAADGTADRAVRLRVPVLSPGREILALPVVSRADEVAGVIVLQRARGFDEREAQATFVFLQPVAIAFDNARLFDEVKRLANVDALTGISNRRHFTQLGVRLFETARRYNQPLAAMMLDVDRFKAVNDRYGHAQGDFVLRAIAARCKACLRSADLLGRFGGEEFGVLLPMTQGDVALSSLAERIRRTIASEPVETPAGPITVTVSIGLARLDPSCATLDALLNRADANLYRAKESGRDRVVVA